MEILFPDVELLELIKVGLPLLSIVISIILAWYQFRNQKIIDELRQEYAVLEKRYTQFESERFKIINVAWKKMWDVWLALQNVSNQGYGAHDLSLRNSNYLDSYIKTNFEIDESNLEAFFSDQENDYFDLICQRMTCNKAAHCYNEFKDYLLLNKFYFSQDETFLFFSLKLEFEKLLEKIDQLFFHSTFQAAFNKKPFGDEFIELKFDDRKINAIIKELEVIIRSYFDFDDIS